MAGGVGMSCPRVHVSDEFCQECADLCAHQSDWIHEYDPESILGDAYWCGDCGELMQVG